MRERSSSLLAYHRTDPQHDSYRRAVGVESIEAWPAAACGLLVGIAEPAYRGVPIVKGKRVTGFANSEEEAVCLRKEGGLHVLHAAR